MSARPFIRNKARGLKFIRYLDMRPTKSGSGKRRRWALFKCTSCKSLVERDYDHGTRMKSCGCQWATARITHGGVRGGKKSPLYQVWDGMKQRCYQPTCASYPIYGGRGIRVCRQWRKDFAAFRKWALAHGYREHEVQIDRRDTDGNYEPKNCRFVTPAKNAANRRYVKLNNAIPGMIRALLKVGFRQRDIWLLANSKVNRNTLSLIARGIIWKPSREEHESNRR